jgi:hypothetical protein
MAMIAEWDNVVRRFQDLQQFASFRPTIDAMLWLVPLLRAESKLDAMAPNVSHAALTLRMPGEQRYVLVELRNEPLREFAISFVDPPLEISETKVVPWPQVVSTISDYVAQLRSAS